ncbi:MAG: hypothetical protein HGA96_07555 [Desulfobulbaceae bacterium]|nr:hypothetical protein [Desulfobulbaceae bacterium]
MPETDPISSPHHWHFFRAGGIDQVKLTCGADLLNLGQLDQKLWMVLSCPTQGLEFDNRTLELIDTDQDGQIRATELLEAINWTAALLRDPDDLIRQSPTLPLAAINTTLPEGEQILRAAQQILGNLGKPEATEISGEDTADTLKIFSQTRFNGDGIIPLDAADDPTVLATLADIAACLGTETDRSGKPGIDQVKADQFFTEAQAYSAWRQKSATNPALLPLAETSATAATTLRNVQAKIDDFFTRCSLAAFDPKAGAVLNRQEADYLALAGQELTASNPDIASFPLAAIAAGAALPLHNGVNPAWASKLASLQTEVIIPLLGQKDTLTEAEWLSLKTSFATYEEWLSQKEGSGVEQLGPERIEEILAGNSHAGINELLARDLALEPEANAIADVDRLVRFHRDLFLLTNNFVSFHGFYTRQSKAVFQAGTLYLDQRHCDLCILVENPDMHTATAHLSRTFLAYCDCIRKGSGEKIAIVAAFTDGDSDDLMVGRNGIFYDRRGRDWDATITKIVENPISIRQAFWSPYKRVLRWIEEQVAKRAAAADTAAHGRLTDTAAASGEAAVTGQPPETKSKFDVGVVAAIGVAVGGLVAALGAILQAFFGLGLWMPLGLVAMMLMISGPSMLIAGLKLHQRNLGPLLNANGWAVNARARINIPFGASLTQVAQLPAGSSRSLEDPFAEPSRLWPKLLTVLIVILLITFWLNHSGRLYQLTGFGKQPAPEARPTTAASDK